MDTDRALLHSEPEVTSPVVGEDKTARIDASNLNLGPASPSSTNSEKFDDDTSSLQPLRSNNDHPEPIQQPSVRFNSARRETRMNNSNGIDWIVPKEEKSGRGLTVGERLQPTLDVAITEKDKYAAKAKWTGFALNAAIGFQVLLGSLTTGLSALSVSGGISVAKATTAIGAISTLVASYLARARGSNEPELSITRTKDLDQFIRECRAFQMDHGHIIGNDLDKDLIGFRNRFEELLGNANGERKLSPV